MRYGFWSGLALLLLLTACQTTQEGTLSPEEYGLRKGATELSAQGSFDTTKGSQTYTGALSLSRFLTKNHEVGVTTLWMGNHSSGSGYSSDTTMTALAGTYSYNILLSDRASIYAGPQAGWVNSSTDYGSGSTSNSSFSYGLHAGYRSFFTANAAWFVEYRYTTYDTGGGGTSQDHSTFFGGLSVLFGGA